MNYKVSAKKGVQDLLFLLEKNDISTIVVSPGSRNAPLTLSFESHPFFDAYNIPDERSAAFTALGIAQHIKKPVVLTCTSGSALLNYYPAVAEAFYQKIPLIIISADRPLEWIDQLDGQTIRQHGALDLHLKYTAQLKQEVEHSQDRWYNQRLINEAIIACTDAYAGPVHLNFPFSEPLYEQVSNPIDETKLIQSFQPTRQFSEAESTCFQSIWEEHDRKLILVGLDIEHDTKIEHTLTTHLHEAVVLTETTSNLGNNKFISTIDRIINTVSDEIKETLAPTLLVTFGGPVISKMIKAWLRMVKPAVHIHLSVSGECLDTYQSLTHLVHCQPSVFFKSIRSKATVDNAFVSAWQRVHKLRRAKHHHFLQTVPWSDIQVFEELVKHIPEQSCVQLANSTPVRYAQLFDWHPSIQFFSNRGTSGIDGSTSTALGYALKSNQLTFIITGDVSFFYDSNAFWNNHIPKNLKVVLINNQGGNIFRFISGPTGTTALEKHFEAHHKTQAKGLANSHGISYQLVQSKTELIKALPSFVLEGSIQLLEIATPRTENSDWLKKYFTRLKD